MSGFLSHANASSKLNFFVMSVAVLALLCVAAPSAKASPTYTSYGVTATGSPALSNCTSTSFSATFVVGSDDSIMFYSSGGCYFGAGNDNFSPNETIAPASTAGGMAVCTSNCGSLTSLGSGTYDFTYGGYGFSGAGVNIACPQPETPTPECTNGFVMSIASNIIILSSDGSPAFSVSFADPLATPEPSSYLLFGSGLLALGTIFRKKLGLGGAAV